MVGEWLAGEHRGELHHACPIVGAGVLALAELDRLVTDRGHLPSFIAAIDLECLLDYPPATRFTHSKRHQLFANPALSSCTAWAYVLPECRRTTPSQRRPRRAAATRHWPAASVNPVLTPSVPGYCATSRGLLLYRNSFPPLIGNGTIALREPTMFARSGWVRSA